MIQMKQIIEIIPNYSEGKNRAVMEEIISPFQREGIYVCFLEMDSDYNRSVVTIIGEVETVIKSMVDSAIIASKRIDLNTQRGEHPRMGAVDVIPLLPIKNISEMDCQKAVIRLAQSISDLAKIPVYLYNKSATREERKLLPNIRRGEFEGLKEKMKSYHWIPDFGNQEPHPQAGVVAIGVRNPLIAYNIDLNTENKKEADLIARKIRFSSGGLPFVQAKAVVLKERGNAQVTMNLTNYRETSLSKVFHSVMEEAKKNNRSIISSEIIGLIPKEALLLSLPEIKSKEVSLEELASIASNVFLLRDFSQKKILDYYLADLSGE